MTKRITSLFTMLLVFALGASAQILEELQNKSVILGGAVAEFEVNKWYVIGSTSDGSSPYGSYSPWDHPEIGETPQHGGFLYDGGIGENVNKKKLDEIEDGASTAVAAKYIVRILESKNQDGAYILQFGTGNYIAPIKGVGDGSAALTSAKSIYDAQDFYIYTINFDRESDANNDEPLQCQDPDVEDGPLPGHFGFCTYDNDKRQLNQNGVDKHFCWWLKGECTYWNSNSHMAIYEVEFGETSEFDAAMEELIAIIDQYEQYRDIYEPGTLPGQFDADALEAFELALDNAHDTAEGPDAAELTADELRALGQAILDAYEALMATQVKFTLATGYYYIESARDWVNTITIPAEDEDDEPTEETIYPTKAIYANGENISWKTLEEGDCTFLWKITPEEGTENFIVQSMANDKYWGEIGQSSAVKFVEEESALKIIPNMNFTNEDGYIVVNLQHATQSGDHQFAHCESHNNGSGVKGNIVGWAANDAPSTWIVVPVAEEAAQQMMADYEIIKNHGALVASWNEMRDNAAKAIEIAKDENVVLHEDTPLVTDVEQLSSPYTEPKEGKIEYLIDGATNNFWHSMWSNGSVPAGTHYLQVELPDVEVENAAFTFTRRNTPNDHITLWSVYGTNDFDAEKEDCELLAEISTPWSSNTETLTSGIFPVKGYAYLRFYIEDTYGPGLATRGYGHMAEFQLYPAEVLTYDPCQYDLLGEVVTNLETLMEKQAEIVPDELTLEEHNAMKEVYDAFMSKYVNPHPLRNKMKDVKPLLDWKQIGNNPGEWKDETSFTALSQAITTADAYDKTSTYTAERSEELLAAIDAAAENIAASANKVQEGKWYRIQMGTEEVYAEHPSWDGGNLTAAGNDPELFGKYLTVAKQIKADDGSYTIEAPALEDVYMSTMLYFLEESDLNEDLALWRFISVGDTAYVMQNKATGMFLTKNKKYVPYVDMQPTLFTTTPVGYGFNIIVPETFEGEKLSPLHAAKANNRLTTWNATTVGTNSAMYIKEAEDVAADYNGTVAQTQMRPGTVAAMCYAVDVAPATESAKLYYARLEGTELSLYALEGNKAKAGEPFIIINGNTEAYNEEDEADVITFVHGYDIAPVPGQLGDLIGTYEELKIGAGKVVASGNGFTVTKKSDSAADVNEAYIAGETDIEDVEAEITLSIKGGDSIESVLNSVAQNGNIYTLDGRMVGKGNLNAVKNLGRGIYILNGVKIAIK